MTTTSKLADLLARYSYREGDFVLSSGRTSSFYLDAKQVTYRPDGALEVGRAVLDLIRPFGVEAVGGLTMGADAIVASVVLASARTSEPIPGFVVRKEPKEHGLQKWIEGVSPKGRRVAIVDDVITSGRSVLRAVEHAQQGGAEIAVVIGLVDREEDGAEAIARQGYEFRAVCTLSAIRSAFEATLTGSGF